MDDRKIKILQAAAARILPSTDAPGALEAGVAQYIQWSMAQEFCRPHQARIQDGLERMDAIAVLRWNREFATCTMDEQDEILTVVSRIPHQWAQRLMLSLINLTLAGFLCHPRYGGNKDKIGWNYINFDCPVVTPE